MRKEEQQKINILNGIEDSIKNSPDGIMYEDIFYRVSKISPIGERTIKRRLEALERLGFITWDKGEYGVIKWKEQDTKQP